MNNPKPFDLKKHLIILLIVYSLAALFVCSYQPVPKPVEPDPELPQELEKRKRRYKNEHTSINIYIPQEGTYGSI